MLHLVGSPRARVAVPDSMPISVAQLASGRSVSQPTVDCWLLANTNSVEFKQVSLCLLEKVVLVCRVSALRVTMRFFVPLLAGRRCLLLFKPSLVFDVKRGRRLLQQGYFHVLSDICLSRLSRPA